LWNFKEKNLDLLSLSEMNNTNAILCAVCSRLLLRIRLIEDDLAKSLAIVNSHFDLLRGNFHTTAPQKRLLSDSAGTSEENIPVDEEAVPSIEDAGNPGDVETASSSPDVMVNMFSVLHA